MQNRLAEVIDLGASLKKQRLAQLDQELEVLFKRRGEISYEIRLYGRTDYRVFPPGRRNGRLRNH